MLEIKPLTRDRWDDLATLFGTSSVTSSCWCMWPRVPVGQMRRRTAEQNLREFQAIVDEGTVPGLLAYIDAEPVGWCSVGPRRHYDRFFSETDAAPVWLAACFFVAPSHRGQGVAAALLEAAVTHAKEQGAATIEGLPRGWSSPEEPGCVDSLIRTFRRAGFREIADPETPAMMRRE